MAPLSLSPHSCRHCRRFVVDPESSPILDSDSTEPSVFFDVQLADLPTAADDNCDFAKWLLDSEWIHRSAFASQDGVARAENDLWYPLQQQLIDTVMLVHSCLPGTPEPASTPRALLKDTTANADSIVLGAHTYQGSGSPTDYFNFLCFIIRDQATKANIYRSREGLTIFAQPDDPAAEHVRTRPIESEVASDQAFTRIKIWLEDCSGDLLHGKSRHSKCPTPSPHYLPTRLVQLNQSGTAESPPELRLFETKANAGDMQAAPYAALSYCWGGEQLFNLTHDRLDSWRSSIRYQKLPSTLKEAVIVCLKLGINYLWVDALCIIQVDAVDKSVEIADMPNIYRNSTLTIAPASASAVTQAFLGQQTYPGSAPAFLLPYRCRAADGDGSQQVLGNIVLSSAIQETEDPLHTRGWTLQERLLSPRNLEFGARQTRWICQQLNPGLCDGWRKQADYHGGSRSNSGQLVSGSDEYAQAVHDWYSLVGVYSKRNLTQPSDRILVMSGIAERYGSVLKDQYVCGMWLGTLRSVLGWNIEAKFVPKADVQSPDGAYQGPTWSWCPQEGRGPQVLGFSPKLKNLAHTYGAVEEGCSLHLRDLLLPVIPLDFNERQATVKSSGGRGALCQCQLELDGRDLSADGGDLAQPRRVEDMFLLELDSAGGSRVQGVGMLVAGFEMNPTKHIHQIGDFSIQQWKG
ncbi:HET domain containing protein [Rhypophila sp. PSN 637]